MELTSVTFMSTFMVVGWEGKHPIYLFHFKSSKCNITTFSWATITWISCKPNVIFKTELLQNLTKIIDIFDGHFHISPTATGLVTTTSDTAGSSPSPMPTM